MHGGVFIAPAALICACVAAAAATPPGRHAAATTLGGAAPASAAARVPKITSISVIVVAQTQQITIEGANFGTSSPYFGDSAYLWMDDLAIDQQQTGIWRAGCGGCGTTLNVVGWSDTRIILDGFGNNYNSNPLKLATRSCGR
jgi:hypothetical protein